MIMMVVRSLVLVVVVTTAAAAGAAAFVVPDFRGGEDGCRIFLDTASEGELKELLSTGVFHGVVTNPPVLMREANQPCTVENLHRLAAWTLPRVRGEFLCQTWGCTAQELYDTGMALAGPARDRIVIKVPVTWTGVQAATKLIQAGCRVCLTAAYHPKQALIAASIGAEYIAPCLGLLNDAGKDGIEECIEMMRVVKGLQGRTRILVACLRDVDNITQLAKAGLHTFAISPSIARQLFVEPFTDNTAAFFEQAVQMTNQKAMLPLTTERHNDHDQHDEIPLHQPTKRRPTPQ